MYHSVTPYERDPHRVTVDPGRFRAQLAWLRRRGLRGVGVGELLAARQRGSARGLVGLTFDDGYRDFARVALPALREHGCSATVFVIAGLLGGHNRWDPDGERKELMTADEVRAVAAAGVEVGAHGVEHAPLTGGADPVREAAESRRVLAEVLDRPVAGFCYPYGAHDAAVLAAVRDAGYDYACATGPSALAGRHALPRTYVGDRDGGLRLAAKWGRHTLADRRTPDQMAAGRR